MNNDFKKFYDLVPDTDAYVCITGIYYPVNTNILSHIKMYEDVKSDILYKSKPVIWTCLTDNKPYCTACTFSFLYEQLQIEIKKNELMQIEIKKNESKWISESELSSTIITLSDDEKILYLQLFSHLSQKSYYSEIDYNTSLIKRINYNNDFWSHLSKIPVIKCSFFLSDSFKMIFIENIDKMKPDVLLSVCTKYKIIHGHNSYFSQNDISLAKYIYRISNSTLYEIKFGDKYYYLSEINKCKPIIKEDKIDENLILFKYFSHDKKDVSEFYCPYRYNLLKKKQGNEYGYKYVFTCKKDKCKRSYCIGGLDKDIYLMENYVDHLNYMKICSS